MGNFDRCQINLTKQQHQILSQWGDQEKRSESEIVRFLLDIGYCVVVGDIEKAERIAGRLHTKAPEYQPENDPG